jgi:predicted Zn finger-like uncharacterized protein
MIVTCPNCQTRYNLPDAKVPAKGAKVKCSKCTHVFKTPPPSASPEEEVESLLEEESTAAGTKAGDEFDETFDEVASGAKAAPKKPRPEPDPEPDPEPEDEPVDDVDDSAAGMDDLFDDARDDADGEEMPAGDDSLFDDADDADDAAEEEEATDDMGGLFADDDSDDGSDADDTGLFEDDDEDEDDEGDEDEDEDEVGDDEGPDLGLGLDSEPEKKSRRSIGCLVIILILALGIGAAAYFKVWTMFGFDLGAYFQNVPYVGKLFVDEPSDQEAAPGESPADRVRKIELKNVKQYYVANEKTGNLFVVEGKAVNTFATPKERITVEVVLYDAAGTVLATQTFLCGNVLSQFQLQVQTQKEITDGLASEVGILSNNTFIRPGSSTPFMAVFFQPPSDVKEFLVKVVDVGDPQ